MNKKYIEVSKAVIKTCEVAILTFSFTLFSVGDVDAHEDESWEECPSIDRQQVEVVESLPAKTKFELLPNIEELPVENKAMCELQVESPYQEDFERFKRELSSLPVLEAKVSYMVSDPGFFFSLKLEDNIRMTISRYVDPEDEDVYVNIWKDDVLAIQDYMLSSQLTEILLSHYADTATV